MHEIRNVQSPFTESDFWQKWSSVNPRMTLCVKVTPKSFWSGVSPLGFTSNTRNMTLPGHPGITFQSSPGITPSTVEHSLGEAGNLEMTGIYQSSAFTREDVLAGKWNFASVEVFNVCWDNVNLGEFVQFTGNAGELKDYENYFTAEGLGHIGRLTNDVHKVTQRSCRIREFRNAECGHTASTVTIDGTAYNVTQTGVAGSPGSTIQSLIFDTSTWAGNNPPPCVQGNDLFANGKITCKSGANNGVSREITAAREATGGFPYISIFVKRNFPFEITGEETFDLVAGCTRTLEDCRKFGNTINFRGEAFVPGIESANRISSGT